MAKRKPAQRKNATSAVKIRQVPIKYKSPDALTPIYANNLLVQPDQSTFILLFYRAVVPLITDEEADRKNFRPPEHVDAECVARIVVPAHMMPPLIAALGASFQKNNAVLAQLQAAISSADSTQKLTG